LGERWRLLSSGSRGLVVAGDALLDMEAGEVETEAGVGAGAGAGAGIERLLVLVLVLGHLPALLRIR
jgi:uncharacterized spore protein YtfJ